MRTTEDWNQELYDLQALVELAERDIAQIGSYIVSASTSDIELYITSIGYAEEELVQAVREYDSRYSRYKGWSKRYYGGIPTNKGVQSGQNEPVALPVVGGIPTNKGVQATSSTLSSGSSSAQRIAQ